MRHTLIASLLVTSAAFAALQGNAAAAEPPTRAQAEEALQQAQDLLEGDGVTTGRELTPLLARVAAGRSRLRGADRSEARTLLARPTDGAADPQESGYGAAEAVPYCTANFCIHYVTTTDDAPDPTDADADSVPDAIEAIGSEFEYVRRVENGVEGLDWKLPPNDGTRGGDARTDVYLSDLGKTKLYGYAAIDALDGDNVSLPSYLVIDNDFAPAQYGGAAAIDSRRPTLAHEYNHVLQFGYNFFFDTWQGEATATWAEEKVFPGSNDWTNFVRRSKSCSAQPGLAAPSGDEDGQLCRRKMYASAVFEHYLEARFPDRSLPRNAFETLTETDVFAPDAYTNALPLNTDFPSEFISFAAASAEWKQGGFGIPDAGCSDEVFPDVDRQGASLVAGQAARTATLDHTGYVLYDVTPDAAAAWAKISAVAPAGVDSAVALVARKGSTVTTVTKRDTNGGGVVARLANPGQYDRITAVVANASIAINEDDPFTDDDWRWTQDAQAYTGIGISDSSTGAAGTLTTTESTSPATCTKGLDAVPDAAGAPRTPAAPVAVAPPVSSAPPATPTRSAAPALTYRLTASARQKRSTVLKRGVSATLACNQGCSATATLTLDRATARELGLSRTIGRASTRLSKAGKKALRVKLSRKARAALRKRSRLRATLTIRTKAASGPARTAKRTVTIVK